MPMLLDPCQEATRLRTLYTAVVTGEHPEGIRFSDEEVRYAKANLAEFKRLIEDADRACALQQGKTVKPRRFARRISFG